MNFNAKPHQKILNRYCFIEFFRKVLDFDTIKNWRSITTITQERFNNTALKFCTIIYSD